MQPAQFNAYLKDPGAMGPEAVAQLAKLVEQFPYFQPAHMLLTLAACRHDSAVYQRTLKKTAIVAPNRSRLFELVMQAEARAKGKPAAEEQAKPPVEDELTLLKVAEHVTDQQPPREPARIPPASEKSARKDPAEEVDLEIGRQVVSARVERELLRTPPAVPETAPATFGDWLAYLKKNNGQPYPEIEKQVLKEREERAQKSRKNEQREQQRSIIDSIIDKNPGLIRAKDEKFYAAENKAKESLLDNEHLVTETLARIYALQGNTGKAIRAYQILSLKNPGKSAYFAGLIEKLRNNEKPE